MGRSTHRHEEQDPLDVKVEDWPADLATFAGDLRYAHPEVPVPQGRAQLHLAAIATAASLLADKGEPAVTPASNAHGPDGRASGLPKRRRTAVRTPVLKTLRAKIVVAVTVALTSFGGLAAAGALPGPLQGAAAGAAGLVGLTLPDGDEDELPGLADEESDQGEDGDDQGAVDDQGDQGEESGDDQGEDGDDQGAVDDQGDQGEESGDHGEESDDQGDQNEDADGSSDANEDDGDDQGTVDDQNGDDGDDGADDEQ